MVSIFQYVVFRSDWNFQIFVFSCESLNDPVFGECLNLNASVCFLFSSCFCVFLNPFVFTFSNESRQLTRGCVHDSYAFVRQGSCKHASWSRRFKSAANRQNLRPICDVRFGGPSNGDGTTGCRGTFPPSTATPSMELMGRIPASDLLHLATDRN